jgi:hypothetical protein
MKILVVCFACVAMSAIYQLVMQQLNAYVSRNFSYIPQRIFFWVYNFSYWLGFCTEEICLAFLVRDFRKFLTEQLGTIFPCFVKSESDKSVGNITVTPTISLQQGQTTSRVVVVQSNIVRVTNAISPNQPRGR